LAGAELDDAIVSAMRSSPVQAQVGITGAEAEVRYAAELLRHFEGRVRLLIDVNQGWDEARVLPKFRDVGVSAVEQPLAAQDLMGLRQLTQSCGIPVIADESLSGPGMASLVAQCNAVAGFSLKPRRWPVGHSRSGANRRACRPVLLWGHDARNLPGDCRPRCAVRLRANPRLGL
jgi:L-alanine-DL-glutamate epimerase-like enolase superfamily enzyme